jgi:propionyl-CoA carboxylase alpha chain
LKELEKKVFCSAAVSMEVMELARRSKISGRTDGGRYTPPVKWVVTIGSDEMLLEATSVEGGVEITGSDGVADSILTDWSPGQEVFSGKSSDGEMVLQVERTRGGYRLWGQGLMVNASVRTVRAAELAGRMPIKESDNYGGRLISPMPGKVVSVFVEEGQKVRVGDSLVIIDAMKMENLLCAESEGIVGAIHVALGDSLSVEQTILEITPIADDEVDL